MKCVSARLDSQDADDVVFLIRWLGLKEPGQVIPIIEKYYPHDKVPARTQFFLDEIFETRL